MWGTVSFAVAFAAWTLDEGEGTGRVAAVNGRAESTETTCSARCWKHQIVDIMVNERRS